MTIYKIPYQGAPNNEISVDSENPTVTIEGYTFDTCMTFVDKDGATWVSLSREVEGEVSHRLKLKTTAPTFQEQISTLKSRVSYLEGLLDTNEIAYDPA